MADDETLGRHAGVVDLEGGSVGRGREEPVRENFERARIEAYFAAVTKGFAPKERPASFLVTHLLPSGPPSCGRWARSRSCARCCTLEPALQLRIRENTEA